MVFYTPPKSQRHSHRAIDSHTTSITDLSDELLLDILSYDFSNHEILSIRLAHPILTPVCSTIICERKKRLYLHPRRASLLHAVEICNHWVFNQSIEELVLLSQVSWGEIEKAFPGTRKGDLANPRHQEKAWKNSSRFKPWPCKYPESSRAGVLELGQDSTHTIIEGAGFAEAYRPLLNALARLPKLRKVAISQEVASCGFNEISIPAMQSHNRKVSNDPLHSDNIFSSGARRSDAEFFDELLSALHENASLIYDIKVDMELPIIPLAHEHQLSQWFGVWQRRLTSIELHLDRGWPWGSWREACLGLLYATENLQHLQLAWRYNAARSKAVDEEILTLLLNISDFAKLKTLKIRSLSPKDGLTRPVCCIYAMQTFIEAHAKTLEEVTFEDVLFIDPAGDAMVASTTYMIVEALKRCPKLLMDAVRWEVGRFGHERRCKRQHGEPTSGCRFQCGRYSQIDPTATMVSMHDLAEELGPGGSDGSMVLDFLCGLRSERFSGRL